MLCPLQTVPCINAVSGCDKMMLRKDLVTHLRSCPANIITCTQEWNRWPLHCRDRWKNVPFRQRNPLALPGQLDYELALRDQKMVGDFYKVPRRTKLALRNNLTRRFPALPLPPNIGRQSNPTDRSARSLKEHVKFEVGDENILDRAVYGVAKLFLKNQENQEKRWKEDLNQAIQRTGKPVPKRYWEYPELERGNIHKHCAYCYDINCDIKNRIMMENCDDFPDDETWSQCCAVMACPWDCGAVYHHCKAFEHKMICPLYEEEGEFDWMSKDKVKKKKEKKKAPEAPKRFPDLLTGPTLCPPSVRPSRVAPPPPPPPPSLDQPMRFDLRIETVTRLQQKPRAMFTFLCGQDLRRDQWEDHCRDVHSEIHGGLNNWLEARCPLSTYGCSYSSRRLYPGTDPAAKIVYSQDLKSFGVRPASFELTPGSKDCLTLTDLPVELLQLVFSYLDSWTLSSLALVSTRLRDLVSGLLDTKGCVALQWEKVDTEGIGGSRWEVSYKRWFFSSHFSGVTRWGMEDVGDVSDHLQTCPYNIRTQHTSPDKHHQGWKDLMADVRERVKLKRDSDWYID